VSVVSFFSFFYSHQPSRSASQQTTPNATIIPHNVGHVKRSVTILHGLPDCVSVLCGSRAVPLGPSILVLTSTSLSDSVSPADLPRFYFDFDCDDVSCHVIHYTIIIDIVKGKLQFILEKTKIVIKPYTPYT
jgi:hypothetical protein